MTIHRLVARCAGDAATRPEVAAAARRFAPDHVPGANLHAYLCRPPAERWGEAWLAGGSMTARLLRAVDDGAELEVEAVAQAGRLRVELRSGGVTCATGIAAPAPTRSAPAIDRTPLPDPRRAPPLAAGLPLGSLILDPDAVGGEGFLDAIGEDLPLYRRLRAVHPGRLVRATSELLLAGLDLPDWIHAGGEVRQLGLISWDDRLEVRGRVAALFERRGHRFLDTEALVLAGPPGSEEMRAVAAIRHTTLYHRRQEPGLPVPGPLAGSGC